MSQGVLLLAGGNHTGVFIFSGIKDYKHNPRLLFTSTLIIV